MRTVPVLENAPDFIKKPDNASMPTLEPSSTGMERVLDAFSRILWWWAYLGQSLSMCVRVSVVLLLHGQEVGSGDMGRKVWRNKASIAM